MKPTRRAFLVAAMLLAPGMVETADAQQTVFQLAVNDPAALNHWPAADGLIGTGDDVVNASSSSINSSGANSLGAYSFNAFDFTGIGTVPDPWMPSPMNAMTFLQGTVTIDMGVASSGGGPLVTAWNVSGTEPYSGHGAYSSTLAAVNSGAYNPGNGAMSLDVDFAAVLGGGPDTSMGFALTGQAWVVDLTSGPAATGNAYVDNVLVPIGLNVGASSLVFLTGSGTVPAANGGSWPAMPVVASLFGLAPQTTSVESGTWGAVKGLYR